MQSQYFRFIFLGVIVACFCQAEEAKKRTISVLPATDITGLNLELPLQTALVKLYEDNPAFTVQYSSTVLPGFSPSDLRRAFESIGSDLISFAYLEPTRIAVFLFDNQHPNDFVVATEPLSDAKAAPGAKPELDTDLIEASFIKAFQTSAEQFSKGLYQPLPGASTEPEQAVEEMDENKRRLMETHRLFRELSSLQDGPIFAGANIGMARLKTTDNVVTSSNNVNFGAIIGWKFHPKFNVVAGIDFFSYSMLHMDMGYTISFSERYVAFGLSLGAGKVLSKVASTSSGILQGDASGSMVFGPGVSLDVPLLGANVRGDIKYYIGRSSIFLGSYGVVFSL